MIFDAFRRTKPAEEHRSDDFSGFMPELGLITNTSERQALTLPAFWRGVRLKSGLISTLPLVALDERTPMPNQPLILSQPDPTEDVVVTLNRLVNSLILRGNAFALLGSFDSLGFPQSLKAVSVDEVSHHQNGDGTYSYRVAGKEVADYEIMHIRGFCLPGEPMGLGVVEVFRRSLSNMTAMEDFSGRYFRDNATPSAILKNVGDPLSPAEAQEVKAKWIQMVRGSREPVVLNSDIEYKPVTISNEDSQFLETKVQSLTDIANIVGVPGYFVGAEGNSMTYSNISSEAMNLSKLYLREEIVAVENAFSALMPEGITAKFNLDDLHRADTFTRYQTYQAGLNAGIITKDEVRDEEQRNPLPQTQDIEGIDPNALNAVVNLVKAGFDSADVLKAFNLPALKYTKPAVPTQQESLKPDLGDPNE